jgi:hypothetical protein
VIYLSYLSNVYRACSFFTNLELFCIDNARVIYRKIRYIKVLLTDARNVVYLVKRSPKLSCMKCATCVRFEDGVPRRIFGPNSDGISLVEETAQ